MAHFAEALQDMQIIARSPSPDRSVSVGNGEVEMLEGRPLESMTKEELIELFRKHRVGFGSHSYPMQY